MKRILSLVLAVTLTAVCVTSCNQPEDPSNQNATQHNNSNCTPHTMPVE